MATDPHAPPAPFWFGAEDPDHIRYVLQQYVASLHIPTERPANSRRPESFIGSVKRVAVHPESAADKVFRTLDEVRVYERKTVPLDCAMRALNTIHAIVTWDREDGIPLTITEVDTSSTQYKRAVRALVPNQISYLNCHPVFLQDGHFKYYPGTVDEPVSYWTECPDERVVVTTMDEDLPDEDEEEPLNSADSLDADAMDASEDAADSCDLPAAAPPMVRQDTPAFRADPQIFTLGTTIIVGGFEFEETPDHVPDDFDNLEYMDDPEENDDDNNDNDDEEDDDKDEDAASDSEDHSSATKRSAPAKPSSPMRVVATASVHVIIATPVTGSTSQLSPNTQSMLADLVDDCGFDFASDDADPQDPPACDDAVESCSDSESDEDDEHMEMKRTTNSSSPASAPASSTADVLPSPPQVRSRSQPEIGASGTAPESTSPVRLASRRAASASRPASLEHADFQRRLMTPPSTDSPVLPKVNQLLFTPSCSYSFTPSGFSEL